MKNVWCDWSKPLDVASRSPPTIPESEQACQGAVRRVDVLALAATLKQVRWDRSRDYTLAVLLRMPPEHFHFRPTPDVWTFAQQLTHVADANLLMAAPFWDEQREYVGAPRDLERAPLIAHLEDSFAYVGAALGTLWDDQVDDSVEFMGACVPTWELLYRILDHVTHHRGQTVVYLHLKSIDPPAYPGWRL